MDGSVAAWFLLYSFSLEHNMAVLFAGLLDDRGSVVFKQDLGFAFSSKHR